MDQNTNPISQKAPGFLTPIVIGMSTVGLSEGDINFNKETLFVKEEETNDAEVSEKAVWFLI